MDTVQQDRSADIIRLYPKPDPLKPNLLSRLGRRLSLHRDRLLNPDMHQAFAQRRTAGISEMQARRRGALVVFGGMAAAAIVAALGREVYLEGQTDNIPRIGTCVMVLASGDTPSDLAVELTPDGYNHYVMEDEIAAADAGGFIAGDSIEIDLPKGNDPSQHCESFTPKPTE